MFNGGKKMKRSFFVTLGLTAALWSSLVASPALAQGFNAFAGGQVPDSLPTDPNIPVTRGSLYPSASLTPDGQKVKLNVDIYHTTKNDGVKLTLQAAVNDGTGKITIIPLKVLNPSGTATNPNDFRSTRTFEVTLDELNQELKRVAPNATNLKVDPGTVLFVKGDWDVGHQWGGIDRGGAVAMPGSAKPAAGQTAGAASAARPTDLDVAYGIDHVMTMRFNDLVAKTATGGYGTQQVGAGLKSGGQIRSRVEAEGKYQIPLDQMPELKKKMFELAKDPALASKVLGADWTLTEETRYYKKDAAGNVMKGADGFPIPDPMVDTYYDNKNLDAAKKDMAIRYRWTEQNKTGAWNFKPGIGKTTKEGVVYRVEYGLDATDDKPTSVKKFVDSDHSLNPFKTIREVVPGATPSEFLQPSVKITDTRYKFKMQHKNGLIVEMSLDDAIAQNLRDPNSKPVKFGQVEMDIDHLATAGTKVVNSTNNVSTWGGTPAAQLTDKAFLDGRPVLHDARDVQPNSPIRLKHQADFDEAGKAIKGLQQHLIGPKWLPGAQKYAVSAHALKLVDDKGQVVASGSVKGMVEKNKRHLASTDAHGNPCASELFAIINALPPAP